MVINFPNSPSVGQLYEFNDKTWRWSGDYWEVFSAQTGYVVTAFNVGGGNEVFSGKSGNDLYFRTISGGTNTTVSTVGNLLKIDVASTTEDLQNTLAAGNTTGGNDIIITNGDYITSNDLSSQIDVSQPNSIYLTTDGFNSNQAFIDMYSSSLDIGFGGNASVRVSDFGSVGTVSMSFTRTGGYGYVDVQNMGFTNPADGSSIPNSAIVIRDNTSSTVNSQSLQNKAVFINTGSGGLGGNDSSISSGVFRTVIVGGQGIDATQSNTAYVNQLALQANGNNFDGTITTTTLTANRTYTFPNNTGTVALLSDIVTENLQTTLSAGNTTSGNNIIMTEGDDVIFKYAGFNNNINTEPITTNRNINFPDNDGVVALTSDIKPFTGNTSGSCITDLYVTNLYGCSPINIQNDTIIDGGLTATTGFFSSNTDSVLTVIGSGNTNSDPLFKIEGSSGELFSVTDSLEGSLFSVNDISGLPIIDVNSDSTIQMGSITAPSLFTTVLTTATGGTENIYSLPTSAYTGGFFDYTLVGNGGARAGVITSIWSGTTTQYQDVSTNDIGSSTSGVTFDVSVSGNNAILSVSAVTGTYTIKTIVRSI